MLSVSRRENSFSVGERASIPFLINDEEHVVLVHELVIPHPNVIDVTGNVGSDCNHIGADSGVSGPWRIEVIARHIVAEQTSCNEQDESKKHAYGGLHCYLLQWLVTTSAPPQRRQTKRARRWRPASQDTAE